MKFHHVGVYLANSLAAMPAPVVPVSMGGSERFEALRSHVYWEVKSRKRRRHWMRQIRRAEMQYFAGHAGRVFEETAALAVSVASFFVFRRLLKKMVGE